jgi:hypothetical protein
LATVPMFCNISGWVVYCKVSLSPVIRVAVSLPVCSEALT